MEYTPRLRDGHCLLREAAFYCFTSHARVCDLVFSKNVLQLHSCFASAIANSSSRLLEAMVRKQSLQMESKEPSRLWRCEKTGTWPNILLVASKLRIESMAPLHNLRRVHESKSLLILRCSKNRGLRQVHPAPRRVNAKLLKCDFAGTTEY
jgi:hypothetical protein